MKRMHINLSVANLDASIRFYSALFAAAPAVLKNDYAKWMLDDPRVNFAITTRGTRKGIDHLGIQAENSDELQDVYARLKQAGAPVLAEGETTCCYARSEKSWIHDPEGIAWETFFSIGESPTYGGDNAPTTDDPMSACCSSSGQTDTAAAVGGCGSEPSQTGKPSNACCA